MADVTVVPGNETSEYAVMKRNEVIGLVMLSVGSVLEVLTRTAEVFPEAKWIGLVVAGLGVFLKIAAALGYTNSRTQVKAAASLAQAHVASLPPSSAPPRT